MLRDLFSLFPAYAGVILRRSSVFSTTKTFPRIRGGDPIMQKDKDTFIGLFPACAGVILLIPGKSNGDLAFPRMCGGDPSS